MKTPDMTLAQYVGAGLASVAPVLTLAGVNLNVDQLTALGDLQQLAVVLLGADAAIRVGRSVMIGRETRKGGK